MSSFQESKDTKQLHNPLDQTISIQRTMPNLMTVVRHGESQANVINREMKRGLRTEYPEELINTPDREIRLTEKGVEQAVITGAWLGKTYTKGFDVIYVSDHTRAKETAAHICETAGWHDAEIRIDPLLGERNWGNYAHSTREARARIMEIRKRDPLHGPMPDGETILETRIRSRQFLDRAARQFTDKNILIFSHGEYMQSLWAEIAHMNTERQQAFFNSNEGDIKNCQVVEFSSIAPNTEESSGKLEWLRSSCPYADVFGTWGEIERYNYSPSELLKQVHRYPRLVFNQEDSLSS